MRRPRAEAARETSVWRRTVTRRLVREETIKRRNSEDERRLHEAQLLKKDSTVLSLIILICHKIIDAT